MTAWEEKSLTREGSIEREVGWIERWTSRSSARAENLRSAPLQGNESESDDSLNSFIASNMNLSILPCVKTA